MRFDVKKVMYLSGVFPNPLIKSKINENDILINTANRLKSEVFCVFTLPYSNFFISKFSSKYFEYYIAAKTGSFCVQGFNIITFPILNPPVKVFFKKVFFMASLFFNSVNIKRVITEKSIDIVHAQSVVVDCFISRCLFEKCGVPYVVTIRGMPDFYSKLVYDNLASAQVVIALSTITQEKVKRLYNIDSVVIPHGVDDIFFQPQKKKEKNNENVIKLVTVCRLLALKNIDKVIYAIAKSKKEIYFDIYGDGDELPKLKALVAGLKLELFINFKGRVDNGELPKLLNEYDCFVMPSFPESLGRVYFEAMAVGLPVVGVRGTGVDGAITDGREGFLLDSATADELEVRFDHVDFCRTKLASMGNNAKALAEDYRWENIIQKLEDVYNQACKK